MDFIKVQDVKEIKILHNKAVTIWNEVFVPIIGKAQVEYMLEKFLSEEAILSNIDSGYEYYLLKENEIFGFIAIEIQDDSLFLSKLYIDREWRGKGFSRKVLDFLESYSFKHDLKSIWLTVNKYNDNAIAVYKRLGFEIFEKAVNEIGCGYVMDDYYMRKTVGKRS